MLLQPQRNRVQTASTDASCSGPCLLLSCDLVYVQKPGKQEVKPTKAQEESGPTNPWVYPEYEPKQGTLDSVMLRAALRSLSIKAGSTDGAMDKLKEMLARYGNASL